MVFFLGTYLTATEYISASKSKGEVLVFRRGHVPVELREAEADDEESIQPVQHGIVDEPSKEAMAEFNGLEKQTAIFHWEDVGYDIKIKGEPKRLLDHVDGWVEPGTLT